MSIILLDLSHEQPNPPAVATGASPKHRVQRGAVVKRNPSNVVGIGIHQTACIFGPANDTEARHRRALRVAAHCTAFRDGTCVFGNPLDWYVYHGNGLNAFSLGLECEGIYSGTLIGSKYEIPDLAIESFRFGLKSLVDNGRAMGMPIRYVWAHRQSSPTRRADPGAEIWQRVVLEYGVAILGLETQVMHTWGAGRPIPREWDVSSGARF